MTAITRRAAMAAAVAGSAVAAAGASAAATPTGFTDGYVQNGDVKIHFASIGKGPAVVFVHGFPDFWLTWEKQMKAVAATGRRAIAIDQRGYNLSDKPKGDENYAMAKMVSDVAAVIKQEGGGRCALVGHDWGGVVSWTTAYTHPEMIERLAICNLPHPNGLSRELANPDGKQATRLHLRAELQEARRRRPSDGRRP